MAGDPSGPSSEPVSNGNGNSASTPPRTFMERMSATFLKPPKPKAEPKPPAEDLEPERELTDSEKRAKVLAIDPTERKIGYAAAILAAAIAAITFLPFINNPSLTVQKTASPIKGHTCPTGYRYEKVSGHYTCLANVAYSRTHWIIEFAILLVFALAVYVTVRIGRRAAVAFVILMTGLALMSEVQPVLAIPFIFVGGWLMLRAWRVQRYGSPTARGPADRTSGAGGSKGTPARGTSTRANGARPAPTRGRRRGAPAAPPGPAPNKRYTPKTPQRRRVPPPS